MAVQSKFLAPWLPLIMSGVVTLILTQLGLVSSLEPFAQRLLFQARGAQPWSEEIVLIKIDEASINALGWFPWQRDRYAQLLHQLTAAEVKTVAFNILFSEETDEDQAFAEAIEDHGQVLLASTWREDQSPWLPSPTLAKKAVAIGHMTQLEKTLPVTVEPHIDAYPALAIATAQTHQLNQGELGLLTFEQPLLAHWPGPINQLQQYSFIDVLEQRIPQGALQGKIALVGMTAAGFDPFTSPIESDLTASGIHLHAAILHSYLQQNFLHKPGQSWGILCLLLWGLGLRFGLSRLTEAKQLIALFIGLLIWPVLGVLSLSFNILLPISFPLLLLTITGFSLLLISNIRLHRINRKLQSKATTDALTGLKNRSFFNDYSAYIWRNSIREKQPICLIICDIDHFKQYNDTYGHLAGDACLSQVARNLQRAVYRTTDLVIRYGGEEFVILLPNSNLEQGCTIAQRIQFQLAQQAIPHKGSSTSDQVTLSFGIACITPSRRDRLMLLIDQADKVLYRAKHEGRDRYKAQQL